MRFPDDPEKGKHSKISNELYGRQFRELLLRLALTIRTGLLHVGQFAKSKRRLRSQLTRDVAAGTITNLAFIGANLREQTVTETLADQKKNENRSIASHLPPESIACPLDCLGTRWPRHSTPFDLVQILCKTGR